MPYRRRWQVFQEGLDLDRILAENTEDDTGNYFRIFSSSLLLAENVLLPTWQLLREETDVGLSIGRESFVDDTGNYCGFSLSVLASVDRERHAKSTGINRASARSKNTESVSNDKHFGVLAYQRLHASMVI